MKETSLIVDISQISLSEIYSIKSLEERCNLSPWSIKDYVCEVGRADSISLSAKVRDELVGFLIARLITPNDKQSIEVEIYNICVDKKYRQKGIGKLLFSKLIEGIKLNDTAVWLEVRKSNKGAISFYKNMGFEIQNLRKNLYSNPVEDGLVMLKRFP